MDEQTLGEIKKLIVSQGDAFEAFKAKQDERFGDLSKEFEGFAIKAGRQKIGGGGDHTESKAPFYVEIDGQRVPVLQKSARLADHVAAGMGDSDFSIGEYVRDVMTGRKAASSSALVPTFVGAQVIDDVRAATTVVRAGAGTIAIDGPTNLAKITGDPTVYEHTEAAADISESDITLAPVTLNPKALVALIPLTMEVVADSPNLDAVLRTSLATAFGAKLDALSLATILADTAIPDSAAGQDPAIWAKCLEAVGAAMGANQPLPTAMITNTADFIARASQLASTAGSWLGKPPVLANMAELPTTGIVAGKAIYGGFERSFAVALRNELRLEVVRWGKATSGSHLLVAHMRGAGVVLQPKGLFIQLKTVV
ncbi:Phage capsid family protein [Azoarcus sp. Aa7]|nr:Phage capsid family protein [Azoarcus sp. Aa7]